ncbi:MAG: TM0996/MTH895 family glutaredoxin-like protein [Deltaproteobacteria bacterium]|nr:TM0996/MTH895 family glutaredoxin-like protein [Deltaproteobacteria bacterium]
MLTIKILGPGCANCHKLEQVARDAAARLGVPAEFVAVSDVGEIVGYGVLRTPGLVVDGRLVASGRVPSSDEVAGWLRAAATPAPSGGTAAASPRQG